MGGKFILMQSTKENKYSGLEEIMLIILEPNKQRFDGPIATFFNQLQFWSKTFFLQTIINNKHIFTHTELLRFLLNCTRLQELLLLSLKHFSK